MSAEMTLPSSSSDRLMFWASVRVKPAAEWRCETHSLIESARLQGSLVSSIMLQRFLSAKLCIAGLPALCTLASDGVGCMDDECAVEAPPCSLIHA